MFFTVFYPLHCEDKKDRKIVSITLLPRYTKSQFPSFFNKGDATTSGSGSQAKAREVFISYFLAFVCIDLSLSEVFGMSSFKAKNSPNFLNNSVAESRLNCKDFFGHGE